MSFRIEKHIVRFYVAMNYSLLVDIVQRAAELGDPKPHRIFSEGLAVDVEAEITAIHEVDHQVAVRN